MLRPFGSLREEGSPLPVKYEQTTFSGGYRCGTTEWSSITAQSGFRSLDVSVSVNPGGANPFQSTSVQRSGSLMRNRPDAPVAAQNPGFANCPSAWYGIDPPFLAVDNPTEADFTRLMASTNPSNPNILLPVFFWELKDIPDMIRQGGRIAHAIKNRRSWRHLIRDRSAARDTATAHLAIEFGWKPFISDMYRLITFQDAVDKRRKMFEKLQKKGLRGRVPMGEWASKDAGETPLTSTCGFVQYTSYEINLTAKRWGTIRWTVRPGATLPKSDGDLRRRMTGLNADSIPIAVWEALPWSWLVDYFVNIGDVLKARNRTLAVPSHACVMTQFVTTMEHKQKNFDDYRDITAGFITGKRNTRSVQPGPFSISAALPTLSAGQLSILGALAVSRAR